MRMLGYADRIAGGLDSAAVRQADVEQHDVRLRAAALCDGIGLTRAWPTTFMPGVRSSTAPSPIRTTSWSSTISKRMGEDFALAGMGISCGDVDRDRGAAVRRTVECKLPADGSGPRGHIGESVSAAAFAAGVKAFAVIGDAQPDGAAGFREADSTVCRAGVADTVAQGFPRNAQQLLADRRGDGGERGRIEVQLRRGAGFR